LDTVAELKGNETGIRGLTYDVTYDEVKKEFGTDYFANGETVLTMPEEYVETKEHLYAIETGEDGRRNLVDKKELTLVDRYDAEEGIFIRTTFVKFLENTGLNVKVEWKKLNDEAPAKGTTFTLNNKPYTFEKMGDQLVPLARVTCLAENAPTKEFRTIEGERFSINTEEMKGKEVRFVYNIENTLIGLEGDEGFYHEGNKYAGVFLKSSNGKELLLINGNSVTKADENTFTIDYARVMTINGLNLNRNVIDSIVSPDDEKDVSEEASGTGSANTIYYETINGNIRIAEKQVLAIKNNAVVTGAGDVWMASAENKENLPIFVRNTADNMMYKISADAVSAIIKKDGSVVPLKGVTSIDLGNFIAVGTNSEGETEIIRNIATDLRWTKKDYSFISVELGESGIPDITDETGKKYGWSRISDESISISVSGREIIYDMTEHKAKRKEKLASLPIEWNQTIGRLESYNEYNLAGYPSHRAAGRTYREKLRKEALDTLLVAGVAAAGVATATVFVLPPIIAAAGPIGTILSAEATVGVFAGMTITASLSKITTAAFLTYLLIMHSKKTQGALEGLGGGILYGIDKIGGENNWQIDDQLLTHGAILFTGKEQKDITRMDKIITATAPITAVVLLYGAGCSSVPIHVAAGKGATAGLLYGGIAFTVSTVSALNDGWSYKEALQRGTQSFVRTFSTIFMISTSAHLLAPSLVNIAGFERLVNAVSQHNIILGGPLSGLAGGIGGVITGYFNSESVKDDSDHVSKDYDWNEALKDFGKGAVYGMAFYVAGYNTPFMANHAYLSTAVAAFTLPLFVDFVSAGGNSIKMHLKNDLILGSFFAVPVLSTGLCVWGLESSTNLANFVRNILSGTGGGAGLAEELASPLAYTLNLGIGSGMWWSFSDAALHYWRTGSLPSVTRSLAVFGTGYSLVTALTGVIKGVGTKQTLRWLEKGLEKATDPGSSDITTNKYVDAVSALDAGHISGDGGFNRLVFETNTGFKKLGIWNVGQAAVNQLSVAGLTPHASTIQYALVTGPIAFATQVGPGFTLIKAGFMTGKNLVMTGLFGRDWEPIFGQNTAGKAMSAEEAILTAFFGGFKSGTYVGAVISTFWQNYNIVNDVLGEQNTVARVWTALVHRTGFFERAQDLAGVLSAPFTSSGLKEVMLNTTPYGQISSYLMFIANTWALESVLDIIDVKTKTSRDAKYGIVSAAIMFTFGNIYEYYHKNIKFDAENIKFGIDKSITKAEKDNFIKMVKGQIAYYLTLIIPQGPVPGAARHDIAEKTATIKMNMCKRDIIRQTKLAIKTLKQNGETPDMDKVRAILQNDGKLPSSGKYKIRGRDMNLTGSESCYLYATVIALIKAEKSGGAAYSASEQMDNSIKSLRSGEINANLSKDITPREIKSDIKPASLEKLMKKYNNLKDSKEFNGDKLSDNQAKKQLARLENIFNKTLNNLSDAGTRKLKTSEINALIFESFKNQYKQWDLSGHKIDTPRIFTPEQITAQSMAINKAWADIIGTGDGRGLFELFENSGGKSLATWPSIYAVTYLADKAEKIADLKEAFVTSDSNLLLKDLDCIDSQIQNASLRGVYDIFEKHNETHKDKLEIVWADSQEGIRKLTKKDGAFEWTRSSVEEVKDAKGLLSFDALALMEHALLDTGLLKNCKTMFVDEFNAVIHASRLVFSSAFDYWSTYDAETKVDFNMLKNTAKDVMEVMKKYQSKFSYDDKSRMGIVNPNELKEIKKEIIDKINQDQVREKRLSGEKQFNKFIDALISESANMIKVGHGKGGTLDFDMAKGNLTYYLLKFNGTEMYNTHYSNPLITLVIGAYSDVFKKDVIRTVAGNITRAMSEDLRGIPEGTNEYAKKVSNIIDKALGKRMDKESLEKIKEQIRIANNENDVRKAINDGVSHVITKNNGIRGEELFNMYMTSSEKGISALEALDYVNRYSASKCKDIVIGFSGTWYDIKGTLKERGMDLLRLSESTAKFHGKFTDGITPSYASFWNGSNEIHDNVWNLASKKLLLNKDAKTENNKMIIEFAATAETGAGDWQNFFLKKIAGDDTLKNYAKVKLCTTPQEMDRLVRENKIDGSTIYIICRQAEGSNYNGTMETMYKTGKGPYNKVCFIITEDSPYSPFTQLQHRMGVKVHEVQRRAGGEMHVLIDLSKARLTDDEIRDIKHYETHNKHQEAVKVFEGAMKKWDNTIDSERAHEMVQIKRFSGTDFDFGVSPGGFSPNKVIFAAGIVSAGFVDEDDDERRRDKISTSQDFKNLNYTEKDLFMAAFNAETNMTNVSTAMNIVQNLVNNGDIKGQTYVWNSSQLGNISAIARAISGESIEVQKAVVSAFNRNLSVSDFYALSDAIREVGEDKIARMIRVQSDVRYKENPVAFLRDKFVNYGGVKITGYKDAVDNILAGLENIGQVMKNEVSSFSGTKGMVSVGTMGLALVSGSILTFGFAATLGILAGTILTGTAFGLAGRKLGQFIEQRKETKGAENLEETLEDGLKRETEEVREIEALINNAQNNDKKESNISLDYRGAEYELTADLNHDLLTITNAETHISVDMKLDENTEKIILTALNVMDAILTQKLAAEEKIETINAETFDEVVSRVRGVAENEVKEVRGIIISAIGTEYEVKADFSENMLVLRSLATGIEINVDMLKLNEIGTFSVIETFAQSEANNMENLQKTSDGKVVLTADVFNNIVTKIKTSEIGSAADMFSASLTSAGDMVIAKMETKDVTEEKSVIFESLAVILTSMGKISADTDISTTQNKVIHARFEYQGVEYEMIIKAVDDTITVVTNRTMDTKHLGETINLMFNALNMKANTLKVQISGLDADIARDKAESILSAGEFKVFDMNISAEKTSLGDLLAAEKVILEKEAVSAENTLNSIETSVNTSLKTQANEITDRVISEKLANLPANEIRDMTQRVYDGYRGIIRADLKYVVEMEGKGEITIDGRDHAGERLIDVLAEKLGLSGLVVEQMTKEFGGVLPYEAGGTIISAQGELRHRPAVKAVIKIAANGELLKLGETDVFKKSDNIVFQYHTHPDVATDVRQYLADCLNVIMKADFFGIEADQMVPMNIYEMGKNSKIAEIKRLFAEKDATGKMRMVLEKFNSETGRFETMEEFGRIFEELGVSSMITRTTMPDAAEEKRFTASLNGVVLNVVVAPVGMDAITGEKMFELTIERPMEVAPELMLSRAGPSTTALSTETMESFVTMMAQKLIRTGEAPKEEAAFELDSEGNLHIITFAEIEGEVARSEQTVPVGEILQNMDIVEAGLDKLTLGEQQTFKAIVVEALSEEIYSPEGASEVLMKAIPKADRTMDRSEATEVEPKESVIPSAGVDETSGYGEYLLRAKEAVTNWMTTVKNYFRSLPVLLKQTGETPIVKIQGITEKDAPISEITGEQIIRLLKQNASVRDLLKKAVMLFDKGFVSLVGENAVTTDKKGFMEMLKNVDANNKRRVLEGKKARNVIVIVGEGEANREISDLVSKYSGSLIYSSANRVNGAVRETFAAMDVPKLRITGITTKADSPNVQSRILNLADTYVLADAKGAIFGLVLVLMVTQKSDFTCAYTAAAAEKIERIIKKDSQKANRPTITFTGANNANTNEMIDEFLSDLTEAEVSF